MSPMIVSVHQEKAKARVFTDEIGRELVHDPEPIPVLVYSPDRKLKVTIRMNDSNISSSKPSIPEGLGSRLGILEVTFHDAATSQDNLPHCLSITRHAKHGVQVLHVCISKSQYANPLPCL
ncbi:hypothetical protein SADUNF_Sadunf17G0126600 [Salix dunnii]|uniref:Uncharacterized protein n=1 Tax=Salix dunnii TaxID=1413687 RepID=A0A835J9E1_9ROSI|nr:hypothetical protein SADUNF_Sadunf17G0126600 [Salix dunnii]